MKDEVLHSSSHMSGDDLKAIAVYLKDQAGHSDKQQPLPQDNPQMVAGEAI